MEGSDVTAADVTNVPHEYSSSTPSNHILGFPLGTALLLVVIFSLSCVFLCFYHRDKVQAFRRRLQRRRHRSLRQEGGAIDRHQVSSPSKPNISTQMEEREHSSLPVIMPGDRIPTFIARPCPCESLPPPLSCPPVKIAVVDMHIVEVPSVPPPPHPPSCSDLHFSSTTPNQLQL